MAVAFASGSTKTTTEYYDSILYQFFQIQKIQNLFHRIRNQLIFLQQVSNNSYTEVLGMQLARKLGQPTTFAGTAAAVQQELTRLGLWHEGAVLYDGFGLTRENHAAPPRNQPNSALNSPHPPPYMYLDDTAK